MAARGRSPLVLGLAFVLPFLVIGGLLVYDRVSKPACTPFEPDAIGRESFDAPPCMITSKDFLYFAEIQTTAGSIRMVLDSTIAPATVNNIVFLSVTDFYDGTPIHKVEVTEDHAFVQMGDPTGTGRGNAGYTFRDADVSPVARYTRGSAAMVFADDDPATAGSQFFIVVDDYEALSYPARQPVNTLFGLLTDQESLQTLDAIAAIPTDEGRPVEDLRIVDVVIRQQERFTGSIEPAEIEPFTPVSPSPSPSGS